MNAANTLILSAWPLVLVWVAILCTLQIFVNIEPKLKHLIVSFFQRIYLNILVNLLFM